MTEAIRLAYALKMFSFLSNYVVKSECVPFKSYWQNVVS